MAERRRQSAREEDTRGERGAAGEARGLLWVRLPAARGGPGMDGAGIADVRRRVLRDHLLHVAGAFRAAGWRVHEGPHPPGLAPADGGGKVPLAVLDDPWIEAFPAVARRLAAARAPTGVTAWRVPRLRGAPGRQDWQPRTGPYTLGEARRRAIGARPAEAFPATPLAAGFAVAPAGEAAELLAAGWPPPPGRRLLVPQVRLYRYDDPADHERREIDPLVPDTARTVVDVGCGHGRLGARLAREGRTVIGIEPDAGMARAAGEGLDLVLAGGAEEALPCLRGPLDCVIFADVLEHLVDPAAVLRLAAERLAPDGVLVASVPNSAWAPVLRDLARGQWEPTLAGVQARDHLRTFTRESFGRLAAECGLEVRREVPMEAPLPFSLQLWARWTAWTAGGSYRDLAAPGWLFVLGRR